MLTCPEVDDNVYEEYRVGKAVEGYPPSAQVVIEKTNGDWQNYQISYQQEEHAEVPVKSAIKRKTIINFVFIVQVLLILILKYVRNYRLSNKHYITLSHDTIRPIIFISDL